MGMGSTPHLRVVRADEEPAGQPIPPMRPLEELPEHNPWLPLTVFVVGVALVGAALLWWVLE